MASDTPQDLSAPIDKIADPKQADALDGGWAVESHSKEAVTPPNDTTEATAGDGDLGDVAESAPARATLAPAASAKPAASVAAAKPKKKQTFQERIDELTGKKGQAERELSTERAKVADLERRLQDLEKRPAAVAQPAAAAVVAPAATAKPAATAPDPLALPDPPKYVDFDSDAAYTAAVAKWRTDTNAVLTAREAKIKADVAAEVDGRFAKQSNEERARAAEAQVLGRVRQIAVDHPDFPELVQTNATILAAITREKAPFIHDMITNTAEGGELFYDIAKDPEMALALAELPIPTRPLADAVRSSPAARAIMKHFATDAGREDFLRLRQLHPVRVLAEVGKLEHALETADRGSVQSAPRPITNAVPPARPPVGSPRARDPQAQGTHQSFDEWMAAEDAREIQERRERVGASATA